ncbi:MAG TPA: response regulator [Candidatus Dormibacteraeota bacterium]|nr:response regulator [Candidatus Dormibacteraeota bacterium]
MPIKVLLADDTDLMRRAIRSLLNGEPKIEIVGEAINFAQTIQMIEDLRPEVVIIDLHMPDGRVVTQQQVKSCLTPSVSRLLAISIWNDAETKALAASFGAVQLLDKARLGTDLIPAIVACTSL